MKNTIFKKSTAFVWISFVLFQMNALAQNVGINSTGATPDLSAILDVSATDKGMLVPRVALTLTTDPSPVTSPATSLLVYNTATVNDVVTGYYYWDGTQWVRLMTNESNDWSVDGNSGTTVGTNFLGTTDQEALAFKTNNVDRMRIHESLPYVSIGHTTPQYGLDLRGTNASSSAIELERYSDNTFGGYLNFFKSRGAGIGNADSLESGDYIGSIRAFADDGFGAYLTGSRLDFKAGGSNGETDMLLFLSDGTSLLSRLWIENTGRYIFNSSFGATNGDYSLYPRGETGPTSFGLFSYSGGADGAELLLCSGQGTKSTHTETLTGDKLGTLQFGGYQTPSTFLTSASIMALSTNDFAGGTTIGSEMVFSTGADGGSSMAERFRITDDGRFGFNTSSLGTSYNGDLHLLSTNVDSAVMFIAPGNTGSGGDVKVYLAEDHDNTYSMSIVYDGTANEMKIEGKNAGTVYPGLVTIQRNTGNTSFSGDVNVTGTLSKGGGTFKIDHPQDPENKYLYHSFVESPDMMNIYNGNITTNQEGVAVVSLPEYFESLNMDFRYQLTVIGTFAQAIIGEEIEGNSFVIKTSEPNTRVSWQVTGVRKDAWANENRVEPVVEKEEWEKGYYLHPRAFGKEKEKSMHLAPKPGVVQDNQPTKLEVEHQQPTVGADKEAQRSENENEE